MPEQLTDERFGEIADRWLPLIWKGAIGYHIPGKFDAEDLVQEGLLLLHNEIEKRILTLNRWEVESEEFEKYFKSALFHRFVDLKRTQATKKRDHTKEVHATEDFDPLANIAIDGFDNVELDISGEDFYEQLKERLTESQCQVLECLVFPPQQLLKNIREHRCSQCLWMGDPTPDGKCPACIVNGFEVPVDIEPTKSPSRVLQAEIQEFLGMRRAAVSDAIYFIRKAIKSLRNPNPETVSLKPFMELFGYGDVLDDDGFVIRKSWPMPMSCRYEEGTPTKSLLTYSDLVSIFSQDEQRLLNYMVDHNNDYYTKLKFTELAARTGMSVHQLREAVDTIRVKLEFIEAGVPLKDIPREF